MSQTIEEALGNETWVVHINYTQIQGLEAIPGGGTSEGKCKNMKTLQLKRPSSAWKREVVGGRPGHCVSQMLVHH